jgi:microcystin-dependent protein
VHGDDRNQHLHLKSEGHVLMMQIRSRVAAAAIAIACALAPVAAPAGTLLPNGMQSFTDTNGAPLAAGCVNFYVPGTNTPKDTYQDAAQTQLNTNPVQLDASGRAVIYGTGVYRQLVQASPCGSLGVTVWDQLTTDTSSAVTIYAGASAGTPNAITVNAPGFSGADGQIINFIATSTNTGGATFNPSGFGAIQIVRDSATGPAALVGGEIVATNSVSLIYDATAGTFHVLSPITWPSASGVPVGTIIPVAGFTAPPGFAFAYGQTVSRTTFAGLFSALTLAQSGTLSSGSPVISGLSDTSQIGVGRFVEGVGIPAGAQLQSCTATTCTMNANASLTRTGTITFFAYTNGDGSTTFNLPDLRGMNLTGRDNMGGTAANVAQVSVNVTTTNGSSEATVSSAANLAAGMWIVGNPNIPPLTAILSISGTTITMIRQATGTQSNVATRFSPFFDANDVGGGGGALVKTLLTAEIPSHTHANSLSDPGHAHGVTDPGHNHTVTDPGHAHGIADPGHSHTKTDPGHSHGITDPGHSHTKTDPGHSHTVTDPGHTHGVTNVTGALVISSNGGSFFFGGGAFATMNAASGISINSATTGVTVNSATTGITYASATTGVTVNSATTGITYASATTGVTVNSNTTGITNNSASTGLTVNSNTTGVSITNAAAGGGQPFQMMMPSRIVNWAIRLTP